MKVFKSYGFWTTFAGAVVILLNALAELFGFSIESKLVENVIMAVAGVLVALGVVSMNGNKVNDDSIEENEITTNSEDQEKQLNDEE